MVVSSLEEAVGHFRASATRNLKWMTGEQIEAWATGLAKAYVARGEIVIQTPLQALSYHTLLASASEQLIDAIVLEMPGSKQALVGILHAMSHPEPVWTGTLSQRALNGVKGYLGRLPEHYYDEACARLLEAFTYCEARAQIDGARCFG